MKLWSNNEKKSSGDVSLDDPGDQRLSDDGYHTNVLQCPAHTTDRKLVNKIDWHVIPVLCVLYLLAFLDRVNISNANVFGLSKELNLVRDNRYNTALVVFFVPYILCEIPSNVLLKRFSPNVWLSGCMFMFGLVTLLQGFVQNFGGLVTTRFFLGVFESGMFPGCFYLIGMWYKRSESQRRFSFFFSSTTLAGAFGGLLASAIGKMDGLRGYAGWRWIFILEGLLTCVISFWFYFVIPSFPEEAKWLTVEERAYVKARLEADQGQSAAERKITVRDVGRVFKDYKVIVSGFMYFGLIVPAYGYAYFAPGIIQGYGYSKIQTQLHSVPPWAAAFGFAMVIAYASDKLKHRFAFTIIPICVSLAGFAILLAVHNHRSVQYGALFLVTSGTYSAMPVIIGWTNMNLAGHHRKSVGSAWVVAFGNVGGIIAVFAFLAKDAPKYITGFAICISFVCLSALSCCIYFVACASQNRSREKSVVDINLSRQQKAELGDMNPEYRYQL